MTLLIKQDRLLMVEWTTTGRRTTCRLGHEGKVIGYNATLSMHHGIHIIVVLQSTDIG